MTFALCSAGPAALAEHINLGGLLALAMGLQNAMVTKLSGAVVRTTHVTGIITDSAVEVAHVLLAVRHGWRSPAARRTWTALPAFIKLRLHLSILTSFVGGAVAGCGLHRWIGEFAMLVPCGILAALAVFDLMLGIRGLGPPNAAGTAGTPGAAGRA